MEFSHVPVMAREVVELLRPQPGGRHLDGTLGGGGHAESILTESRPDGELLGLDRDEEALEAAQRRLERFGARLEIRQANFSAAAEILDEIGWHRVDGVVLDLGLSSHQVEAPERGFSFRFSGRLDMRMDRRQSLDAYAIVNHYSATELEKILREFGEEPQARRIAAAIVAARKRKAIETTEELAMLVVRAKGGRRRDHHPATQTFQALRMAVNQELEHLRRFLEGGYRLLNRNGRMVIISFQSLEDRAVKEAFRKWSRDCICPPGALTCRCGWSRKVKLLTKKPLTPSADEIRQNPRARSAKLRAVERI
ncbi:MAG TPA: 16S rRNA (cytosine(1402)-N(4))-methyltransferase RsmH [Candidatus Binatia bacterium]|jgi:16S rRNA (cytosine1402-N4)-methyltransferase